MITNGNAEKPFTVQFVDGGAGVRLELTSAAAQPLKCVEVLSIFLKDEATPGGGPSRAHIRFEAVKNIPPREKAVMPHKTLIDGKLADPSDNQLERLRAVAGTTKPYVLDISWEDAEGKSRFQRIPVGH